MSYGVFMGFITDAMPSSTETISILAVDISALLVLSSIYVLLCVFTMRLFDRDDRKDPIPKSVQTTMAILDKFVGADRTALFKVGVMDKSDLDENSGNDGIMTNAKLTEKKYVRRIPVEVTWKNVSRTLDKFFFRCFAFVVFATNIAICITLALNYF